jgi:hypothetical protein
MRAVAMSSDHSALMPLVLVESPYAGDVAANVDYARLCLRDALSRSEAPIAVECHSQLTQPKVLDDDIPDHRTLGIDAGLAWLRAADASVVYKGHSISSDMFLGIETARCAGVPVEFRRFDGYVTPDVTALDPHAPERGPVASVVHALLRQGWSCLCCLVLSWRSRCLVTVPMILPKLLACGRDHGSSCKSWVLPGGVASVGVHCRKNTFVSGFSKSHFVSFFAFRPRI